MQLPARRLALARSQTNELKEFSFRRLYPLIVVAIFLMHAPLLRLPFFWDEAGFYVPAAYDLAHSHTLIAKTTLDTGHPHFPRRTLHCGLRSADGSPPWRAWPCCC